MLAFALMPGALGATSTQGYQCITTRTIMIFFRAAKRLGAFCAAAGIASIAIAQTATDDSGYRSNQTFRSYQASGTDEESHPTVKGRLEWLKARYGAVLPADLSRRVAQELATQRATYPQLAPGATPSTGTPVWRSIGPT